MAAAAEHLHRVVAVAVEEGHWEHRNQAWAVAEEEHLARPSQASVVVVGEEQPVHQSWAEEVVEELR